MRRSTSRRTARVRVALVGLLALGAPISSRYGAFASETGPVPGSAFHDAVPRPRLDAPAAAETRPIRLPSAAPSDLLLANKELIVPARLRVMIFAPHPDDETLAAAGLIQRVNARDGRVRVVFVTNGDGYVDGVQREVRRTRTSTADFIKYGKRRHDEAVRALRDLGVNRRDALFLGFPDDGIDDLWAGNWSTRKPYTSPYTRFDRPSYKDSLSRRVEYAGTDLEGEIIRTLRDFVPDWVLMPDPRDRHPDHCTTGVFVLDALRQLRQAGEAPFGRTQVFTYLVHYPDYPASPLWVKEIAGAGVGGSLTAGKVLSAAHWLTLPLTEAEQARKQLVLSSYHSQVHVMQPFLRQFLRSFELFGQLDAAQVVAVPYEYAARFRRAR